ncbi:MAG: hypothetical protein HRU03_01665 [Nanoarchaeales archaeon]|nr:hypothetical protein [Nanoarchaeales archaeon]
MIKNFFRNLNKKSNKDYSSLIINQAKHYDKTIDDLREDLKEKKQELKTIKTSNALVIKKEDKKFDKLFDVKAEDKATIIDLRNTNAYLMAHNLTQQQELTELKNKLRDFENVSIDLAKHKLTQQKGDLNHRQEHVYKIYNELKTKLDKEGLPIKVKHMAKALKITDDNARTTCKQKINPKLKALGLPEMEFAR